MYSLTDMAIQHIIYNYFVPYASQKRTSIAMRTITNYN